MNVEEVFEPLEQHIRDAEYTSTRLDTGEVKRCLHMIKTAFINQKNTTRWLERRFDEYQNKYGDII